MAIRIKKASELTLKERFNAPVPRWWQRNLIVSLTVGILATAGAVIFPASAPILTPVATAAFGTALSSKMTVDESKLPVIEE